MGVAVATEKILILYDNRIDDATITASSEAGALGAVNLKSWNLSKVARTTGLTDQWWRAAYAQPETVDTVALWNHNLDAAATIRVRLSDAADMSDPVFDQTFDAWPSCYGVGEIGLGLCGLGGTPILSDLNDYKPYTVMRLGGSYEARYLRIDLANPDLVDGFFEAGRLIAGVGFQPQRNFSYGWEIDWIDPSEQIESDGGAIHIDKRNKYRVINLPFKTADKADALGAFNDLKRIVGNSRDILVMPFPDHVVDVYRVTVYGLPVKGGVQPVRQVKHNLFTTGLKVREII